MEAKAYSFTPRTKVFADGTGGRLMGDLRRTRGGLGWRRVSDLISVSEVESEAPRVVGQPSSTISVVTNRVTERSEAEWAGEGGWRR
jgi:hypothetical protein